MSAWDLTAALAMAVMHVLPMVGNWQATGFSIRRTGESSTSASRSCFEHFLDGSSINQLPDIEGSHIRSHREIVEDNGPFAINHDPPGSASRCVGYVYIVSACGLREVVQLVFFGNRFQLQFTVGGEVFKRSLDREEGNIFFPLKLFDEPLQNGEFSLLTGNTGALETKDDEDFVFKVWNAETIFSLR